MEFSSPRQGAPHPADAVEQHYDRLTALLTRHAGSADAARELLHDTWLRLARAPSSTAANAPAYAYAAARHLLVDQHRHLHSVRKLEAAAARNGIEPADTTLHAAAHRQALGAIEQALAELPPRTREVFLQHRLLDVPQAELARRHGVSLATVERDMLRAAAALHAALARWEEPPAGKPSARRRGFASLLGVAGLVGSGALWRLWQQQVPQWRTAWHTLRAQQAHHRLPDGSLVELDAQTALAARYYGNRRVLTLSAGAAYFDVVRDADRPFTVDCGPVRVTVLGTRFAVERQGQRVRVDVESGRVEVNQADAAGDAQQARAVLTAGEALLVGPEGEQPGTQRLPATTAPWRAGRLSFDGAPLADILERLSRYHPRGLTADPRVAAWPVTAEIRIALADEWLRHVLPRALPVATIDADGGLRVVPRR